MLYLSRHDGRMYGVIDMSITTPVAKIKTRNNLLRFVYKFSLQTYISVILEYLLTPVRWRDGNNVKLVAEIIRRIIRAGI